MKKQNNEISIFNTFVSDEAKTNICKVLDSTFLSEGKLVKEFEDRLSDELGLKNPVAVNSGTSALHLALVLAGIRTGDEVICPPQTFVATAIAIMQCGATPIFADIQYETGNIDPKSIEEKITLKTKAILPVHWGGYPCDMDEIHAMAKKQELVVIEDAAHALGATYHDRPIGSLSDFSCFSFQAIKHVTTGDGGAVACLKKSDADRALVKRWFGIDREHAEPSILGEREYDITEIGYKYHLNDYAAALGISNLLNFKKRLAKRQTIAKTYQKELVNIPGIRLFQYANDRESAYWLFGMHVEKRDDFICALKNRGITASVIHRGIDRNTLFGGLQNNLVNQRHFDETQIHIPIHDGLSEENVSYIIASIKKGW
jgi:perosamine synthetase